MFHKSLIKSNYLFYLVIALSLIPMIIYGYVFINYSTNAPYYDDYYWGISFLKDYLHADNLKNKLELIFQQHAQHRIAFFRFFMVIYYHLLGTINFKHLTIIGNIENIIVFFTIAYILIKSIQFRYFILPFSFIFFQFQYYQNIISTYGFPNNGVIMWVVLTFYALTKKTNQWLILTLIFALFSVFSNGNGILCFPIILFFLLVQGRYVHLKWAAFFLIIVAILYFTTFERSHSEIMIGEQTITYFFKFLSAAFYTGHKKIEAITAVLILLFFGGKFSFDCYQHFFKNRKFEMSPLWIFASSTMLWIIATALSVAVYRAIRNASIPNWYMNYSILFIIIGALFFILSIKNKYLKILSFLFLTIYGYLNYLKNIRLILPTAIVFHNNLSADIINQKNNKNWSFLLAQVGNPLFDDFQKVSKMFIENGIYKLPNDYYLPIEKVEYPIPNKGVFIQKLSSSNESWLTFNKLANSPKVNEIKERFGFIKSKTNIYYFGVVNPVKDSLWEIIKTQKLFKEESFFIVQPIFYKSAIEKGEYQIGMVYIYKNNETKFYISDQKLKIENY